VDLEIKKDQEEEEEEDPEKHLKKMMNSLHGFQLLNLVDWSKIN